MKLTAADIGLKVRKPEWNPKDYWIFQGFFYAGTDAIPIMELPDGRLVVASGAQMEQLEPWYEPIVDSTSVLLQAEQDKGELNSIQFYSDEMKKAIDTFKIALNQFTTQYRTCIDDMERSLSKMERKE